MTLERTCRKCGTVAVVTAEVSRCQRIVGGTRRNPERCGEPYGRFVLGLDRDPMEPTATSTEAQREAAFQRSQQQWLASQQQARQEDPETT